MREPISREEALRIATEAAGGFLGTWVQVDPAPDGWHVSAASKSSRPPMLYVIDSSGRILLAAENCDDATLEGEAKDGILVTGTGVKLDVDPSLNGCVILRGSLRSSKGRLTLIRHG